MTSQSEPHLLVDGDIIAYRTSVGKDENGNPHTMESGISALKKYFQTIMFNNSTESMTVAFTSDTNFRKEIYPAYKGTRATTKPELYEPLRDYIREFYPTVTIQHLEADDTLGILATEPSDETRIIVSIDKDMRQIPGLLFAKWDKGVETISEEDADLMFYRQWITGDSTDGYCGIPGVGPKGAEKMFIQAFGKDYMNPDRTDELDYRKLEEIILNEYKLRNYDRNMAVAQAQLARILRYEDYDLVTSEITLWEPSV